AGSLAINVWVAPEKASQLRELRYRIAAKQVSLEIKPRVFNENLANLVLYVQETAREGFGWDGIMLADMNQPDQPRVTFARSGNLIKDEENHTFVLTLTNGSTHVVSPLQPDRYSFDTFETTTISVPMPEAPAKQDKTAVQEIPTRTIWNNMQTGTATYEEHVEFHRRFALPFACLFFALAGLPLGVSTTRGSRSMGLVLSLILMLIYYLTFVGGTRIAGNAQFSPFLGAWLPDIYVLRGFWFFFVLVLIAFVSVFILVTLFELLPDIVKNRVDTVIVVTYFVYLLPQILYYVIPLTVLLAILINLGTLTKTNETLAVKAGAISLYRLGLPLILMGLALSGGIYFVQDFMLPYSNQRQDEYRNLIK